MHKDNYHTWACLANEVQVSLRLRNLEDSENFACACVSAEFRFHLVHPYCLRLYCVASENQALERLTNVDGEEEDNA